MGTIKDLVDLVTQLSNSVEDRKFAAELRQIQGMIGGIQSEHAGIHEQRINLMTENAELKQTNAALQQKISSLQQEIIELKNPAPEASKRLPEEAENILLFLAKHEYVAANQLAHSLSVDLPRVEYWLGEFDDKEMASFSLNLESPSKYFICHKGREYLMENMLI